MKEAVLACFHVCYVYFRNVFQRVLATRVETVITVKNGKIEEQLVCLVSWDLSFLGFPPPIVKSNYVFVHLSSCLINYKNLRKKPSHILQKISLKLTNAHWLSTFLVIWERKESGRAIFIKFIAQNYLGPCS